MAGITGGEVLARCLANEGIYAADGGNTSLWANMVLPRGWGRHRARRDPPSGVGRRVRA